MNKKQAAIILTLMALIVCVGILAAKANGNNPLYVDVNDPNGGKNTAATEASANALSEARMARDHANTTAIQSLQALIDDKNAPAQSKTDATKEYTALTLEAKHELDIEAQLKLKGFDDTVCFIEDNKATIIVKAKDTITENQRKQIYTVVMDVAKIKDVDIEQKQ